MYVKFVQKENRKLFAEKVFHVLYACWNEAEEKQCFTISSDVHAIEALSLENKSNPFHNRINVFI